ncbi:MAG: hypothetical protein U0W40_19280 [Acidimicrobiia bacterium]
MTTTHGCWPLVIVAGPAVERLGMATAESVFSGGGARRRKVIGWCASSCGTSAAVPASR